MSFFTNVQFPASTTKISHQDKLLTLGSCFAASMSTYFLEHGFPTLSNPYGIIYHPLVLSKGLERIAFGEKFDLKDLEKNKAELWHSWDHHSSFSHQTKELALEQINTSFEAAKTEFPQLDWLIITFGTAYGYRLKSNKKLVVNCHKYPANYFKKELSEVDELLDAYIDLILRLQKVNSKLKIILTVSPIRHKKEGLINNNRSKARLLILAEKLAQRFDHCHYFPSYEYLMDELRDYRFFDEDLVHPSSQAEDFIWEKFSAAYFNSKTQKINGELMDFQKAAAHRPLFPDTAAHQHFLQQQLQKMEAFQMENPGIDISEIKNKLQH